MNVLLLGPQGSGKGTQAKLIAKTYGIPQVATGDMIREMKELDTPLGQRGEGDLRPRRARRRRPDRPHDPRPARPRRHDSRASSSTASRATWRRPRRSTRCCSELGRDLDVVFELQVADREVLIERIAKRAAEEGRTDDTPDAIRKRLEIYDRETAPLVEYYRDDPRQRGRHPRRPADRRGLRRDPGRARPGGGARDHPQVARRRWSGWRAPAAIVADTLALIGEHARPGRHDRRARRARRGVHHRAGRLPDLQGLPRLPGGDLHLAERRWSSTGSPGRTSSPTATSSRSTSASRSTASSPTPPTRSRSARSLPRPSGCSRSARRRSPPGSSSARPATGSRTSPHAVQQVTEAAGFSVVRSLVGHGVGRSMHEDPQIPNYGQPGRGPAARRGDDVRDRADDQHGRARHRRARRRVVDLDRRRLAFGPFRAHRGRDGGRSADPDGGTRFATMRPHGAAAAVPWLYMRPSPC